MKLYIFIFILCFVSSLRAEEEKTSTRFYSVGELGARWPLGSDHLPVGGTIGSVHFVVWNILHSNALHHIVDNTQGLRDSFIMTANIPLRDNLTLRESTILDQIFTMIYHPTHPRSLLALEETSKEVYKNLREHLPKNFQMIPNSVEELSNGDIFIYDSALFDFVDFRCAHYKHREHSTYMTLTLLEKQSQILYKFVQSHVPGGPDINSVPARLELANAVMSDYNPEAITLVLGDMNRSPDYFIKNFASAAIDHGLDSQPFKIMWPPYPTHVNTHKEASWIDNIFMAIPPNKQSLCVEVARDASVFFPELQDAIDLLEEKK